jgi:hypothetical protein
MTTLEAINRILATIGEQPVSSLDGDRTQDVSNALAVLTEVCISVQSRGWRWNTDYQFTLPLDAESKIPVPSNTLTLEIGPQCGMTVDQRAGLLYDTTRHSFTFTAPVTVARIVRSVDFDLIPAAAQQYICIRSARLFTQRWLDSEAVGYTLKDELDAWASMQREETNATRPNLGLHGLTGRTLSRRSWK